MASKTLKIIIEAQNKTNKAFAEVKGSLDKTQKKLKSMKPTFKKMAVAGTVAFGAVAVAIKGSVSEAAKAEGSYNKFNTVFGEFSGDMLDFVKDIRKEMPTATSEIVRMAADMQDLLVPMGLSREVSTDMSKGFLEVANKIAAFNDVDPTEVLEAIKSGIAGSSEPLKRFGVNALESALEVQALKSGLLKAGQSFKDLDPEVKIQIRSQALLAQVIDNSSDAINGFEKNNDSFIRRQQDLQATITETKETIGRLLLPIFDQLLKKILPIIQKLTVWIEKNPELTKKIIIVAGVVAGLVAVIGGLGLILPSIIGGIGAVGAALTFFAATPVGVAIVAIAALVATIIKAINAYRGLRKEADAAGDSAEKTMEAARKLKPLIEKAEAAGDTEEANRLRELSTGALQDAQRANAVSQAGFFKNMAVGLGIGSYDTGGIVPGATGQPQLAVVHGGEEVLTAEEAGTGGRNVFNFTFNGDINDKQEFIRKIREEFSKSLSLKLATP